MELNPTYNISVVSQDIDGAWEQWYKVIAKDSDAKVADSRDGAVVGEVINAVTVIADPTRCILRSPIRKLPMRYLVGELLWYLSANPKLEAIQLYTKAWDRMSDDGIRVNSNYGDSIKNCMDFRAEIVFDQYEYVKDLLKSDPNSRQAIIHIKTPRDTRINPTKDLNCTICLQFFLREGRLYCTTYMRSNDLWMGFPNDVFQFTAIQIRMAMELGVELGSYTHIAGSLHLYDRDFKVALANIESLEIKEGSLSD